MYLLLNNQLVKEEEAVISPFDHGYMYGLGVFETFRIYDGHPFLLDDHFQRLRAGLQEMRIEWETDRQAICDSLNRLLTANGLTSAYVRWNVSAGYHTLGLSTEPYKQPTTIVYMKPLPNAFVQEKKGILLQTRRNTPEGERRLKSHHYLNSILGKREVGDSPDKEGIFLTEDGYLAEGVVSNLFWVKGDIVYTPSVTTGILDGITRQFILALCAASGIRVEVGRYPPSVLLEADGAFVTNSIQELVVLRSVDGVKYGEDHLIISTLKKAYQQNLTKLWSRHELIERS